MTKLEYHATCRKKGQKLDIRRTFDLILRRAAGHTSLKALSLFMVDLQSGVLPGERTLALK